jgi:hypothetical protein
MMKLAVSVAALSLLASVEAAETVLGVYIFHSKLTFQRENSSETMLIVFLPQDMATAHPRA